MGDIKKDILREIENKIKRKENLRARKTSHLSFDHLVLDFMEEVRNLSSSIDDHDLWVDLVTLSIKSLRERLRVTDPDCDIEVRWYDAVADEHPQVNGVLVKWSSTFQAKSGNDPELFIDGMNLLLG